MKFEEILPALRAGKKVRDQIIDDDGEYWVAGYIGICLDENHRIPTIHRMNKDGSVQSDKHAWGISRAAIMGNDWELVD